MPFCRYCGDLVLKDRCRKCGSVPVAASFSWGQGNTKSESPDRWKQTYTVEKSVKSPSTSDTRLEKETTTTQGPSTPVRRFPRPQSAIQPTNLNNRISEHISATTTERTPINKHAKTASLVETLNSSPSGNPVLDDGVALSKVYGSILQSPDSLKAYVCASCNAIFTRDSTLYPDPEEPTRMLCRPCFLDSNGTKGECATCHKPVVRLRQEGQYVENSGKLWHNKCFVCDGCSKNLSSSPSVDLYGRPCCPDCFDTSLHRPPGSKPSSKAVTPLKENKRLSSVGGIGGSNDEESSPVIDELSRRLRLPSKESSPSRLPQPVNTTPTTRRVISTERFGVVDLASPPVDDLSKRLRASTIGTSSPSVQVNQTNDESPSKGRVSESRLPILSRTDGTIRPSSGARPALQPLNTTPDLASDVSDGESRWSSPRTPKVEPPLSADDAEALCDNCNQPLFSVAGGGRIVTTPAESGHAGRFHSACFVCAVCKGPFIEKEGAATFVVCEEGLTHLHCAPPPKPKIVTRQRPISMVPLPRPEPPAPKQTTRPTSSLSNHAPRPVSSLDDHTTSSSGAFNMPDKSHCAGCHKMVAVMEPGVVPGPNGTRWHSSCLVCGGKGNRKRAGQPGCGKRLDRDAKLDPEGKTWCSNCMTLLILNGDISSAPLRTPVSAVFTGGNAWLSSQGTGSSVASHSTGSSTSTVGPTDAQAILNRRNSNASPTKGMLGGTVPVNRTLSTRRAIRPRPKSVSVLPSFAGMGTGGRLNLVREITGASIADSTSGAGMD